MLKSLKSFLNAATSSSSIVYRCREYTPNKLIRNALRVFALPAGIFRYFVPRKCEGREGLAFVLIAKNEAPYIEEWLNFHRKQGVTHFIIYDNESTDNFHEVLKPYIDAGLVTYQLIRGKARQLDAYNAAINEYKHKFKYMAILDADEFMFIRNNTHWGGGTHNLYEFVDALIKAHPHAGGLGVNWCIFGSNGHIIKPAGGVLENYTMRAEDNLSQNRHIKTVCDPTKILGFINPHYPIYCRGYYNIDENGEPIVSAFTQEVHFSKIRINHYFTKSFEEFKAKRALGMADHLSGIRPMHDFDDHDQNVIHDTEILSHI